MIGIDVVDLRQAASESNWKRKGYLDKIYDTFEQEHIACASDPGQMVWLLWTMKEAVYKIISRATGLRTYRPLLLICRNVILKDQDASGEVFYHGKTYFVHSTVGTAKICTVAVGQQEHYRNLQIDFLPFTKNYRDDFNNCSQKYQLSRDASGFPVLIHQSTGGRHAVSVSHHGRYAAIAYSDSLLLTS